MSVIGDKIKRWCQEESLSAATEQDDETALAYTVSLSGEPSLAVSVRGSGPQRSPIVLAHTLEMPVPSEIEGEAEGRQQVASMLERVAASRSDLVGCRLTDAEAALTAEVTVTLHEDGLTKQSFLSALEEIRKVRRVIGWQLEGMSMTAGTLSNMRAMVEQTEALVSEMTRATEELETPAAGVEAPSPAAPGPAPQAPPPAAEVPAAPAARFCPNCGRPAKPQQRFCTGCGTSLQG